MSVHEALAAKLNQVMPHNEQVKGMLADLITMCHFVPEDCHEANVHTYMTGYMRGVQPFALSVVEIVALVDTLLPVLLNFIKVKIASGTIPLPGPAQPSATVSPGLPPVRPGDHASAS